MVYEERSLLQYIGSFSSSLPNPTNQSKSLPFSATVGANTEVARTMREAGKVSKRRKPYNKYTSRHRATIGKYKAENGVIRGKGYFESYSYLHRSIATPATRKSTDFNFWLKELKTQKFKYLNKI